MGKLSKRQAAELGAVLLRLERAQAFLMRDDVVLCKEGNHERGGTLADYFSSDHAAMLRAKEHTNFPTTARYLQPFNKQIGSELCQYGQAIESLRRFIDSNNG